MKNLKVIIIDDEKPARRKIRLFLELFPQVTIEAEAGDGLEALSLIEKTRPDLIFLDIQMPRMNGFQLLEVLPEKDRPQIIFTTAYDEFAVKAFEVRAVDYLLKPFDQDRFCVAVERVLNPVNPASKESLNGLIKEIRSQPDYIQRILLRTGGKIVFIKAEDIVRIEAAEKYLEIYTPKEMHLHRSTMQEMEKNLNPALFMRIHRSHLVNINMIKELHPLSHGDYVVVMKNDERLPLGRSYKDSSVKRLERGIS